MNKSEQQERQQRVTKPPFPNALSVEVALRQEAAERKLLKKARGYLLAEQSREHYRECGVNKLHRADHHIQRAENCQRD